MLGQWQGKNIFMEHLEQIHGHKCKQMPEIILSSWEKEMGWKISTVGGFTISLFDGEEDLGGEGL